MAATPNSILSDTKKVLGIEFDYDVFDLDIKMHINSAFDTLHQLGLGPEGGFYLENEVQVWEDFFESNATNSIKTYVFLRVKLLFDPPQTSYHLESLKQQRLELEWRLNVTREETVWVPPV